MATTTIKPNGQGGDYTSLSAWEAARQAVLSAPELGEIDGDWSGGADTTVVSIDGWTTSAANYISIYTTAAARHSGKWDATKYRLEIGDWENAFIYIAEANVRINGLQFKTTGSGKEYGVRFHIAATGEACKWYMSNNIFYKGAGFLTTAVSFAPYDSGNSYTYNNIFIDVAVGIFSNDWSNSVHYIHNNTFHSNTTYGINRYATGQIVSRNNLFKSNAIDTNNLTAANQDYNATNNASLGYTAQSHDRISQTFTFVDEVNDDFHLASNDAGARDYGVSDPGSGLFSDDIDGQTRSGTWDIGADEYVAAGGFVPYPFSRGARGGQLVHSGGLQ